MKRFIAISLLFIFIAGQVNLTWATHFCGDFAVQSTLSIGIDDLGCGMEEESCCNEGTNRADIEITINQKCCSNDYYYSDSDDFFNNSEANSYNQILFVASYIEALLNFCPENDEHEFVFSSSPPLIHTDRQIMYQSFLL